MTYNPSTGWARTTDNFIRRHGRLLEGQPKRIDDRIAAHGIEFYWDTYGNIHTHCLPGVVWEILTGTPNTMPIPAPDEVQHPVWISATDLGAVFEPMVGTSTVLKHLRELGLLERQGRKDVPTAAAAGLFFEREASEASGFDFKPGTIQRLWSYAVVEMLRSRSAEVNAASHAATTSAAAVPKPSYKRLTVRFPATCATCSTAFELGALADWSPETKALRCLACGEAAADA